MHLIVRLVRGLAWVAACAVLAVPFFSAGSPISLLKVALVQPSLTITGSIDGLVAGRPGGLTLTVHSDADAAVVVHTLAATVAEVVGCGPDALVIAPWIGALTVPARGAATANLQVALAVGSACPGATWQLHYTAV